MFDGAVTPASAQFDPCICVVCCSQKLLQFLKLQEEEKDRLACQNMTISHSRASEDTQK